MNYQYAEPLQYCPECGKRVVVDDRAHAACIAWGIQTKKYTIVNDWVKACVENGERVVASLGVRNFLPSSR